MAAASAIAHARPDASAGDIRRPRHRRWTIGVLVGDLVVVLTGNALPGPLLPRYQVVWGLTSFAATAIFAIYAIGILVAVLLAGRVADQVGPRPVIVSAVVCSATAAVIALTASDVGWLYLARVVQGVAAGLVGGAVTAAITQVNGDPRSAARWAAVATTSGITLGLLVAGVVGQLAGSVLTWPWVADLSLLAAALIVTCGLPDALAPRQRPRLTLTAPGLPDAHLREFSAAIAGVSLAFACMGLLAGLGATLALSIGVHGILGEAAVAALAYTVSGITQVTLGGQVSGPRPGLLVLILGLAVLVLAIRLATPAWLLTGAALIGLGNGLAFPVTLGTANRLAPSHRRAEIVSTYNVAMYGGVVTPLIATALIADAASLRTAAEIVAAAIGAGVIALAVLQPTGSAHRFVHAASDHDRRST